MSDVTRRWALSVITLLAGGLAAVSWMTSSTGLGVGLLLVFVVLAWLYSPWFFPRPVSAAEAARRSQIDGKPIVFWRPGCRYCLRLRIRLRAAARGLHWVDIWLDQAAAELVRGYADGNETVPTVLVGGRAYINPDPSWVRRQAASAQR